MLPGITFVVSPLLSLMEDQTRALLAAGARPSYLNSSLTPAQQNTVLKRAREGRYQLMYVAPERLLEPRFLAFAQEAAGSAGIGVPLVAIDEAHCVSQWGQDFRPAYLQIREFIDSLPQRPIVAAFTATGDRTRACGYSADARPAKPRDGSDGLRSQEPLLWLRGDGRQGQDCLGARLRDRAFERERHRVLFDPQDS